MFALIVKICLGFTAFVTAVIGLSKGESLKPGTHRLWRRLSKIGMWRLGFAVLTLGLVILNEWLTHQSAKEAEQKAAADLTQTRTQLTKVEDQLADSRKSLGMSLVVLDALTMTNETIVQLLDNTLYREGTITVSKFSGFEDMPLKFADGRDYVPERGDTIEWAFECSRGSLPPIPSMEIDNQCGSTAYGRLFANSTPIPIRKEASRGYYYGDRSTGGTMSYRSPSEGSYCVRMGRDLEAAGCVLKIDVLRLGKVKFAKEKIEFTDDTRDYYRLCRKYEALYGQSCAQFMKK